MKTPTSPERKAGALDQRQHPSTTTRGREAPAYQEYAAGMMSRIEYRVLTLPQRGLLYSMRLECWVNHFLPESPEMLGRVLGYDPKEVAAELPYVISFFACENGRITSPELESYRAYLDHVRERKSQGGKRGADITNGAKTQKRRGVSANPSANPSGMSPTIPPGMPSGHLRDLSTVQPSLAQPRGEVFNPPAVDSTYEEWGDFTADPEEGEE